MMIYPVPQNILYKSNKKYYCYNKKIEIKTNEYNNLLLNHWCKINQIPICSEGILNLKFTKLNTRELTYIEENYLISEEKYRLDIDCSDEEIMIEIEYAHDKGLWYGLNTILKMIQQQKFINARIIDYPLFKMRGFIEGFYGKPWKVEQRISMLRLLSKYGMNTYFYAPKDDIYHREKWKTLYDNKSLNELINIFDETSNNQMDFYYSIGPGLTMRYSNEDDFKCLMNKIDQLYKIGVTNFGLLLDDIPDSLQYEEDRIAFDEVINAHIHIVNKFYRALKKKDERIKLVACPLQYHGKGNEYYISKFGQGIDSQINIFWTGKNICSQEIDVIEAVNFTNGTRHKPLYWDNYPVNDAGMVNEMHMGPFLGRTKELYRYSNGLVANGMEYCEASKVPFITIASYLWNTKHYNPEECWYYSLREIIGEKDFENFKYFAEHIRYSCLEKGNSPQLSALLEKVRFKIKMNQKKDALSILKEYLIKLNDCYTMVQGKMENKVLNQELEKWIEKFLLGCKILNNCLLYLEKKEDGVLQKIKEQFIEFNQNPTVIFSHALIEFVDLIIDGKLV